jgi:dolichol-phosphate mannosyltransferase
MPALDLSVVNPAYREADALRQLLPALLSAVDALGGRSEIIVSDSMSPLDDTAEVCAEFGVKHICRVGGDAYGDAVRSGINSSQGRYVLLIDADGSHNPEDIDRLWDMRNRFDVVIGSRYVKGGHTENPLVLIWMSRVLNYMYRFAFCLPVNDVSNSFRLYRGQQLRSLVLISADFDIVEEILIRLVFGEAKATVVEVPATFERRKAGESKRNLPAFMLTYMKSIRTMRRFMADELRNNK